jgi:hypothetical protein
MHTPTLAIAAIAAAFYAPVVLAGESVPINELDTKVVEAIRHKFPDAELVSASRETDDGRLKHEVKIRHQGQLWEVDVADNGEITEMEREGR